MIIEIVRRPIGEAPDWVRDAWIGLHLPASEHGKQNWHGAGVISGPTGYFGHLWARLRGRTIKVAGYAVHARNAVDRLDRINSQAALWWRENTPQFLKGDHYFVFDEDACRVVPD